MIGCGLVALPLGDTFVTQRNMIDPQVQAIQAGAEMARVGLLLFSDGPDFVHADSEWAGLGGAPVRTR
jgi:hypothetical protein